MYLNKKEKIKLQICRK